jgi:sugar phosphate isomerase/epimerase
MNTPIALQLWSVRESLQSDFAGTVSAVAAMGYDGVEIHSYGDLDAGGAQRAVAAAGLHVAGLHVPLTRLETELPAVIAEVRNFDTRNVVCPWFDPKAYMSSAAFTALGERLDRLGTRIREAGLVFHFHNHRPEMLLVDGRPGLDWLADAAQPRNLLLEFDTGWSHFAGKSPVEFLREQGRRVRLIHLRNEKELAVGPVDFPAIFAEAARIGAVEWYIVEQDDYSVPPLDAMRQNIEQVHAWLGRDPARAR